MSEGPSPHTDDPGRAGRGLLTHAVGAGRHTLNQPSDVRTVQHLLNMAVPNGSRLAETGRCDALLIERIKVFQVNALHFKVGDGRVDPGGRTLAALLATAARAAKPPAPRSVAPPPSSSWYSGVVQGYHSAVDAVEAEWSRLEAYLARPHPKPPPAKAHSPTPKPVAKVAGVTADQIRQIMPQAGSKADEYVDVLNAAMAAHGIDKPEQRAALLGQISDETGQLHRLVENMNYSAARIVAVWPSRFPTTASATPYAHNPEALGNKVYGGRMGNGPESSGDGYRFRGRGFLQITGREKYRRAGMESNPDGLADPTTAANSAADFWINQGLNDRSQAVVNRQQYNAITLIVNGGQQGSQNRWDAYQRALKALHCGPTQN